MEEIVCPKCHSNQVSANQKGFSTGKAVLGNIAGGALLGAGMGMAGSNRIIVTCLKCGNQFKAGDGSIKTTNELGDVSIEKQVYIDKEKAKNRKIAMVGLIILIIIIIAIAVFFNSLGANNS